VIAVGSPGSGGSVITDGSRGNAPDDGVLVAVGVPVSAVVVVGLPVSVVVVALDGGVVVVIVVAGSRGGLPLASWMMP
jgi:hypothetical protein